MARKKSIKYGIRQRIKRFSLFIEKLNYIELIILVGLGGGVAVILGYLVSMLVHIIRTIFRGVLLNAVGTNNYEALSGFAIFVFIIIFLLVLVISLLLPSKFWVIITGGAIVFLLVFGMVVINQIWGPKNPSLLLRDYNTGNVIGNFTCSSQSNRFLVDERINCHISPQLTNVTGTIRQFIGEPQSRPSDISNNDFSFVALHNVNRITVYIQGMNDNESFRANSGYAINFLTKDEDKTREDKFIAAMIALVATLFLSVPAGVKNVRDLWKSR